MALASGRATRCCVPALPFCDGGSWVRVGATPIFVDSCPVCFNMKYGDAARSHGEHEGDHAGASLRPGGGKWTACLNWARSMDSTVIEDAAQAMGATYPATRWAHWRFRHDQFFSRRKISVRWAMRGRADQ